MESASERNTAVLLGSSSAQHLIQKPNSLPLAGFNKTIPSHIPRRGEGQLQVDGQDSEGSYRARACHSAPPCRALEPLGFAHDTITCSMFFFFCLSISFLLLPLPCESQGECRALQSPPYSAFPHVSTVPLSNTAAKAPRVE